MSIIEKVKLLFAVKKPVAQLAAQVKQAKAGWNTLGFWISVTATLGALATAIAGYIPATTALIITTVIPMIYNILRAFRNAGADGITPPAQSTRFWVGILGMVSSGIVSLQTGGLHPEWLLSLNTILAAIMAAAQSVGAQPAPSEAK